MTAPTSICPFSINVLCTHDNLTPFCLVRVLEFPSGAWPLRYKTLGIKRGSHGSLEEA